MYSGSWPKLYVTTALARFAGFVSMVVFACGERTKRSGRSGRGSRAGAARFASVEAPHPTTARQPAEIASAANERTRRRLPAAAEQPAAEPAAHDLRAAELGLEDRRDLGPARDDR